MSDDLNVIAFPEPQRAPQEDPPNNMVARTLLDGMAALLAGNPRIKDVIVFHRDPDSGDFLPAISSVEALQDFFNALGLDVELEPL